MSSGLAFDVGAALVLAGLIGLFVAFACLVDRAGKHQQATDHGVAGTPPFTVVDVGRGPFDYELECPELRDGEAAH